MTCGYGNSQKMLKYNPDRNRREVKMKTIIRENYYHRKLWDEACLECELKKDKTLQSLDGENVNDQLQARYYEELQRVLRDMQASQRSRPSWISRLKFKLSSIISIKVARHNEMNIHIQASSLLLV